MIDLDRIMEGARTCAISGHVRPDGDAVGACLGLYDYLTEQYPEVEIRVYLEDFQDCFLFLKGSADVCRDYEEDITFDVFFAVDTASPERLGDTLRYCREARTSVCIDHHISNPGFCDINWIRPEASSASELVACLLDVDKISFDCAQALYLGIVHDTGVFNYSCTSPETMRVAAMLMEKGLDHTRIIDTTFFQKEWKCQKILGRALEDSRLLLDGAMIYTVLSAQTMREYGVVHKDLEGIVAIMRYTTGVEAAVFLHETETGDYRVSMRSNGKVDVNLVATAFGGGGHTMAAGCTIALPAGEAVEKLAEQILLQL